MKTRTKLIHEGEYVVAVDVQVDEPAPGWEPSMSLNDAIRLDDTRAALRAGDLKKAAAFGRLLHLTPLTA